MKPIIPVNACKKEWNKQDKELKFWKVASVYLIMSELKHVLL